MRLAEKNLYDSLLLNEEEGMNNSRRERLRQAVLNIQSVIYELEQLKDEEDEARGNMPENLESSTAYEMSENCSDVLEDAMSDLNEVMENISEIT